jgi:hypothetical protein
MTKQIFREQALDRLSSPEQLDRLMSLTSPRQWLALASVGCLFAVLGVWGVCGSIATMIDANGVITRPGGVVTARAVCSGPVVKILVQVGDMVRSGQELAHLRPLASQPASQPTTVISPCDGRVFYLSAVEGDLVSEGDILVAVENVNRPLGAVVFVPASEGHRVPRDAQVQLTFGRADRSATHPLHGQVTKVGQFPVSRSALGQTLQSEDWAASMAQYGPMLEVIVTLGDADDRTPLVCGMPCQARIAVATQPPYQLLLGGSEK